MVLYLICPKCGYERKPLERAPEESCPGCGLIFAKYVKVKTAVSGLSETAEGTEVEDDFSLTGRAKGLLFHVPSEVDSAAIYQRAALFVALITYGVRLAAMDIPSWEMSSATSCSCSSASS